MCVWMGWVAAGIRLWIVLVTDSGKSILFDLYANHSLWVVVSVTIIREVSVDNARIKIPNDWPI